MKACKFPFSIDEADASCECWGRGELGARNSVEGITGDDVGVSICVSNNGLGESGDSAGGEVVVSLGAAEGMIEIMGESAIGGDATGGETGEIWVASVSISTFIPWLQCPIVPQMKYLFPCDVRGMFVAPSL